MGDLIKLLSDYLPEFSSRHADALRLLAASAATWNALHGWRIVRWAWRRFSTACRWCMRLASWIHGA